MKENRLLTADEKLALVQLIGISNTVNDLKKNMGSYLKNNLAENKKEVVEEEPPVREEIIVNTNEDISLPNTSSVNITDASIYDSKYLDLVKNDLANQKPNIDERKTEIINEPAETVTNEINTEPVMEETTLEEEPDISVNERYGYLTEEELFGDRKEEPVKEAKAQVLEKRVNPWEGLRTVSPGEK
jgi:hypothetical protein